MDLLLAVVATTLGGIIGCLLALGIAYILQNRL